MLARKELDQVSLNLLLAANNLDRDGWIKFSRGSKGQPHCLLGALDTIFGNWVTDLSPEVQRLHKAIGPQETNKEYPGRAVWDIACWNNDVCQSKAEAVAKLREAAYAE